MNSGFHFANFRYCIFSRNAAAGARRWFALTLSGITVLALSACGGGTTDDAPRATGEATGPSASRMTALSAPGSTRAPETNTGAVYNTITLRASSTIADNLGALVQLRYNGLVIANEEVRSPTVADFTFNVAGTLNGGMFDVVFSNASFANGAPARKLTIVAVVINGTNFSPTGPGVTYDLGHGAEAFDGIAVVAGTSVLTSTGALRIPLPSAAGMGPPVSGFVSDLSPEPGPYVDINFGSDTNSGTLARPYRTLARVAGRQLVAGEHIHLRCGNQWRESLQLGVSQLVNNTRIVPYGSDCAQVGRPVISGSDAFNGGWVKSGAVWSRSLPAGTAKITRLWVGYEAMRTAQWPNSDQPLAVVRGTYAPDPWRFWMTDADAATLAGKDLRGSTVLLRTQPWRIELRHVAPHGSSGSEVAISTNPEYTIQPGQNWMLRDKLWMLDAPGEFFHDVGAQRLYVVPAAAHSAADLNVLEIEGSVRATALELRSRSQLVVRGLALRNAQQDGLRLTDVPQALISDVDSRDNGGAGIRLMQWEALPASTPGPRVESSYIAANGEFGIDAAYVNGAVIEGNRVLYTGMGLYTGDATAAIAAGSGAQVLNNFVDGAAYVGIMFSTQGSNMISGNEITHYCMRLTDCGAIYSWSLRSAVTAQQTSTISGNRIHGPTSGVPVGAALDSNVVAGIYLDDFSQRVTVRSNFLQDAPVGVLLHNASYITVESNQIWFAGRTALAVSMDRFDGDWAIGNALRNNEIVPKTTASSVWPALPTYAISHPVWFGHALLGQDALAPGRNSFSGNRVVQLNGVIPEHAVVSNAWAQQGVDIERWRQLNPGEPDVQRPMTFSPVYLALGPEKVPGGQFDAGLGTWRKHWNWQIQGYDVQNALNQPGCIGPCVRMTAADMGDAIVSPAFNLRPGIPHVYSWTATSSGAAGAVGQSYLPRQISPWDNMHDPRGFVTLSSRQVKAGQSQTFESFFTPKSSDPMMVMLQLETIGVPIHFDAVSVREVLGWAFSGPREWASVVVATKGEQRTVGSCGELGWPSDCQLATLTGTPVNLPLTVPPGSQQMLLWANSPYRR